PPTNGTPPVTEIGGSPVPAPNAIEPATAAFDPMRVTKPPAQRTPSPKADPFPAWRGTVPWKSSAVVVAGRSVTVIVKLSAETRGVPLATSRPPPVANELSQPWPAAPTLPHGQAVALPSPAQNGRNAGVS